MTLDQIIEHFGTKAAAARAINQSRANATNWSRSISYETQCKLQKASRGKLKADKLVLTASK
jgi:hypothetical protein